MHGSYKTMKYNRFYFLFLLFIFLITYNIVRAQNLEPLREPEITNFSGRKYYPTVKEAIDKAEKSIFVAMYIINYDERNRR